MCKTGIKRAKMGSAPIPSPIARKKKRDEKRDEKRSKKRMCKQGLMAINWLIIIN